MKTTFRFKFASLEITKGDQKLTLGEGTSIDVENEYDVSEVVESIKSLPQIISVTKDAVLEIVKAASEFNTQQTENSIKHGDACAARDNAEKNADLEREIKRHEMFRADAQ